ncbi:MoaD/ThiS family protein [Saccharomonospora azurea]|uniref:MoaD/ThiS family protein n=1 Tax=Saccharomonospora azurea TaxID=40988 RepID=UPI000240012C|nr:MoaD/ThiS family protein [Saccharomonospora azurea]EHK87009.1 sulfur transfer protein ThiS [Saccharomonospora azurea SZMC 14600]
MTLVRYFAAARAQAGVDSEEWQEPDLGSLVEAIGRRHGERMAAILDSSSLLVDGTVASDRSRSLDGVDSVDVLPPFAGG